MQNGPEKAEYFASMNMGDGKEFGDGARGEKPDKEPRQDAVGLKTKHFGVPKI